MRVYVSWNSFCLTVDRHRAFEKETEKRNPSPTTDRNHGPSTTDFLLLCVQDEFCETFGQHEQLTTRINRLLEGYSRDASIFKELLQNADDAGATEVCHSFLCLLRFAHTPNVVGACSANRTKLAGHPLRPLAFLSIQL